MVEALATNPAGAPLPSRSRALVDLAIKLTREPYDVRRSDVTVLRDDGFTDRGIHDAVSVIAYYNYVNRLAAGLGVDIVEAPPTF